MAFAFSDERWLPKSILCLRDYNLNKFAHDVIAGITVGLVALPLAMAFSVASGLSPQAGIYCAIVTGFLVSALGGAQTEIDGAAGASVVGVAGIVSARAVAGLGQPAPGNSAARVAPTAQHPRLQRADMAPDSDNRRRRHSRHDVVVPRTCKAHSGTDRCHAGSHRHGFCITAPRGDYWHALWRNPQRPPAPCSASLACGAGSWTARAGVHRCDAGCDRVADVGGCLRPHEQ